MYLKFFLQLVHLFYHSANISQKPFSSRELLFVSYLGNNGNEMLSFMVLPLHAPYKASITFFLTAFELQFGGGFAKNLIRSKETHDKEYKISWYRRFELKLTDVFCKSLRLCQA